MLTSRDSGLLHSTLLEALYRGEERYGTPEELKALDSPEGSCSIEISATLLYQLLTGTYDVHRNSN